MTFRARPITTRKRRFHFDDEERTQFWVTLGFIGLIVLAVLILGGAVAAGYYNDHFRIVARVEGVEINRDQYRTEQRIALYRVQQQEGRVREALAAGTIDESTASARLQQLSNLEQSISTTTLDSLVDGTLQGIIAATQNLTATDAEVDEAIREEASTPELRKVQAIVVTPESDPTAAGPTDEQVEAARSDAEEALAKLEAGDDFASVASEYSTDASKDSGGDYGWLSADASADEAWVDALFALAKGGTTEVIEGEDGAFRIGRVTDIRAAAEDSTYVADLPDGVSEEAFRQTVKREVVAKKLRGSVGDPAVAGEIEQVFVSEIVVTGADSGGSAIEDDEIRASHILYSPNDDPSGAASVAEDDPAWKTAEDEAKAAAAELREISDVDERKLRFATLASDESDDSSGTRGGDLGWFTRSTMVQEFGDALFEGEHTSGEIIGPVKSQFGWHVIMYEDRRPPPAQRIEEIVRQLKEPDADFAALARRYSDGATAARGGEIGWVAPNQLDKEVEDVLFRLQPGQVSDARLEGSDYHIYKVTAREKRPVDPARREEIKQRAFSAWYDPQKEAADIWIDPELSAGGDIPLE